LRLLYVRTAGRLKFSSAIKRLSSLLTPNLTLLLAGIRCATAATVPLPVAS